MGHGSRTRTWPYAPSLVKLATRLAAARRPSRPSPSTVSSCVATIVAGVIVRGGTVLLARRSASMRFAGKWEFPGGKVEPGEEPSLALARELREELALQTRVLEHFYDAPYGQHTIAAYWVQPQSEPTPLEHAELIWSPASKLQEFDLLPADVEIAARLALLEETKWPTGG